MSLVVVRQRTTTAQLDRQSRLPAVDGLDLRLLVDREHQRVVGLIQVEPDDIDDLLGELQVADNFEGLEPMRLGVGAAPDLAHLPCVTPA